LKENEALKLGLDNQRSCRSIKRPDISIEKLKMVVADKRKRKALEQKRNWLEVTLKSGT
jgi:hypothetical protein